MTDKPAMTMRETREAPAGAAPPVAPAQPRMAAFDNPGWHGSPGAARWMPPLPHGHPDDRVLGPCPCRY